MSLFETVLPAVLTLFIANSAFAEGIEIDDAYFLTTGPMAKTGAAFLHITNAGDTDDRLISASSDVAKRVEIHTHLMTKDGIMQMREVEDGLIVPAHGTRILERGGDHVMFMGLAQKLAHGDIVTLTLTFENTGDIVLDVPVDLELPATREAVEKTDG